ncbi:MAG: MFS family permease [Candidatus Aldehydirespiratoraceae bacterium]
MTATQASGQRAANAITVTSFRNLWACNVAFFLVMNAQRFAFGWVVLDLLLKDEGSQGLIVFTLGAPTALLVLQAGVWADRLNRKKLLLSTQLAGAAVMATTAVVIGQGAVSFGWLVALTLLAGSATAIGQPVRSSLVPALVSREQLFSAIALNAIAMTLSLILGPVLIKVVGDQFGFDGAFWFQAGLLIIGSLFLTKVNIPDHERGEKRPIITETLEAVRHILDDKHLTTLFTLLFTASLTISPAVMVTVQAHVKDQFGRDAGDAAYPFAAMGVGMAISSFYLMRKGDMANKGAVFQRAMMMGTVITFFVGIAPQFWQVIVLGGLMGLSGGFFINMNQGLIQANTPQHLMGRVMGVYTLVANGLFPLGALVLGIVATNVGTRATICGAAIVGFTVVTTTYVRNTELRNLS